MSHLIMSCKSVDSEYRGYLFPRQLCRWAHSCEQGKDQGQKHYKPELVPWEYKVQSNVCKLGLLQGHRVAYGRACEHPQYARTLNHYEGLIKVGPTDLKTCKADGPKNSNFFGLFVQVGTHGSAQGEEAQEHHDADAAIKDEVKHQLHLL